MSRKTVKPWPQELEDLKECRGTNSATRRKNTGIWLSWLHAFLKAHKGNNSLALRMNSRRVEWLRKRIMIMDWVNSSPVTDDTLGDFEFAYVPSELKTDDKA